MKKPTDEELVENMLAGSQTGKNNANRKRLALLAVALFVALAVTGLIVQRFSKDGESPNTEPEPGQTSIVTDAEVPVDEELWVEESDTVQISDSRFSVYFVYPFKGSNVRWVNASDKVCKFTLTKNSDDSAVVSRDIGKNEEVSQDFNEPGEFMFKCADERGAGYIRVIETETAGE